MPSWEVVNEENLNEPETDYGRLLCYNRPCLLVFNLYLDRDVKTSKDLPHLNLLDDKESGSRRAGFQLS